MSFTDKRFQFQPGEHNGKRVIWIRFERNQELITYLRSQTKARWSASRKSWYVTDNRHHRQLFGIEPAIVGKEVLNKIHIVNISHLSVFRSSSS